MAQDSTNSTSGKCSPTPPSLVDPIFNYAHNTTIPGTTVTGCNAITGGAFVPNGIWPGFDGLYLFLEVQNHTHEQDAGVDDGIEELN